MEKEARLFLEKLINSVSPSGFEDEAIKVWRERTRSWADSLEGDVHGNSIAILKRKSGKKIMLAGHIDEIGYMVKYINKEGFIYFSFIGGVDPHLIPGQRVWIKTDQGRVLGVIGRKPIHLLKEKERGKVAKLEDLWIDIGVKDDEEAKKIVQVGDVVVPGVGFEILRGDRVIGRGFDDRVGAFIVSEVMRLLSEEKGWKGEVYGVATVQEEIGLRGARTSAYGISPDVGIAVDVTFSTDHPDVKKNQIGDLSLDKGPVIARGPNVNPKIFAMLKKIGDEKDIPYQVEGISRGTGTDANVIQLTKSGVATGLLGLPCRYIHSPVEMLSLQDVKNTVRLLKEFVLKALKTESFIPFN